MTEQTSRYIFRLLAVKKIFTNPSAYGFVLTQSQLYPPLQYDTVRVDKDIRDLADFARRHGITYYQLRDANPWLRRQNLVCGRGKAYDILLPTQESIHYDPSATVAHDGRWVAY